MKSVRTLMLAPETPVPATSGSQMRMLHLARALAKESTLEIAAVGDVPAHDEPFPILGTARPHSRLGALVRSVNRPYLVARLDSPALGRIAEAAGADTVQAVLPFLVPAALRARTPIVLDAHNIEADIAATLAESDSHLVSRLRWRWEAAKTTRFERWAVGAASAVAATSDADAEVIDSLGAREVVVVPNGVDTVSIRHGQRASEARIVYIAHFGYRPNVLAANELADRIMPRILAAVPSARLSLVGREARSALSAKPGSAIDVVSDVHDVLPFLRAARVCVIPLRAGSGTRLKALEAMAAGVPVVSTSLGVAGIEARDNHEVLLAESSSELAAAAIAVLRDDALAARLAAAGRKLAESRYDWSIVSRPLVELHLRLAAEQ